MIIMCKGDSTTPARFWLWIVCDELKKQSYLMAGFCVSNCKKYLNKLQLKLIDEVQNE